MRTIIEKKIRKDYMKQLLQQNVKMYKKARDSRSGLYLGGLRQNAIFQYYGNNQQLYKLTDKLINFLLNSELGYKRRIEDAKWSKYTYDRPIQKYHYHLLERDLEGKELTDEEEADRVIFFPQKDNNEENMTDNDIYLHHVKLMYEQGIKHLQRDYSEYDLSTDEGLEQLYLDLYSNIGDWMTQMAVELNNTARVSNLIDLHNILVENNIEPDDNNDIIIDDDDEEY